MKLRVQVKQSPSRSGLSWPGRISRLHHEQYVAIGASQLMLPNPLWRAQTIPQAQGEGQHVVPTVGEG